MMTREEMIEALDNFCGHKDFCNECPINKFGQGSCDFDDWSDYKLMVAYDITYKNGEARLDGGHLTNSETGMPNEEYDVVYHPKHYNQGGIECIDCIKAATIGKKGIEAVCVANVIKYLFRYEEKNGVEDVRKARWYLDRLLNELEESQQG